MFCRKHTYLHSLEAKGAKRSTHTVYTVTHGSTIRESLAGPAAALVDEPKKPSITDTLQCRGNHQSLSQLQSSRGTRLDNTDHQALTAELQLQLTARTLAAWQTQCWEPFDWVVALFTDGSGIYISVYIQLFLTVHYFFLFSSAGCWVGTPVPYSTAVTVALKLNCGGRRKETLSKRKNSSFLHMLQSSSEKLQCILLILYSTCLSNDKCSPIEAGAGGNETFNVQYRTFLNPGFFTSARLGRQL